MKKKTGSFRETDVSEKTAEVEMDNKMKTSSLLSVSEG